MNKLLSVAAISTLLIFSTPTQANVDTLSTCLVDSLNGKERKELAKWIYFAMAAHPEINKFSNISANDRLSTDKNIGQLVSRLLVDDCANELVAAQKSDPFALEKAFEMVGQVAMQELMTSQNVTSALTNYMHYSDQQGIANLFTR